MRMRNHQRDLNKRNNYFIMQCVSIVHTQSITANECAVLCTHTNLIRLTHQQYPICSTVRWMGCNFAAKWCGSSMRIISSNWVDHLFRNLWLSVERKHHRLRARVGESVWLNDVNRSNTEIMRVCMPAQRPLVTVNVYFIQCAGARPIELLQVLRRSREASLAIREMLSCSQVSLRGSI